MYLYLHCLYIQWQRQRSAEQCISELDDFVKLASGLLHHTEDDIRTALAKQLHNNK